MECKNGNSAAYVAELKSYSIGVATARVRIRRDGADTLITSCRPDQRCEG